MTTRMVTIVDYGSGNLRSVQKAFERLGAQTQITDSPQVVAEAQRLVLPGVGSFGDAMQQLHARELVQPILSHLRADRPFLESAWGCNCFLKPVGKAATTRGWAFSREMLPDLNCQPV